MREKRSVFTLKVVLLFLFIISLIVTVTINFSPLYSLNIGLYELNDIAYLSKEQLLKNYHELLTYLNFPWVDTLVMTDFSTSSEGAHHFLEVKRLFLFNYSIFLVTCIPSILTLKKFWKERLFWRLVKPFQIAAVVPVVLVFFMLIGFNTFFVTFHKIFFRNDDWLFDPSTDPIILVLPEEFFFQTFLLAIVLFECCCLAFIFIGRRELNRKG